METKKPYAAPTITEHGDAVKETRGWGVNGWEAIGKRSTNNEIEW